MPLTPEQQRALQDEAQARAAWQAEFDRARDPDSTMLWLVIARLHDLLEADYLERLKAGLRVMWERGRLLREAPPSAESARLAAEVAALQAENAALRQAQSRLQKELGRALKEALRTASTHRMATAAAGSIALLPATEYRRIIRAALTKVLPEKSET